MLLQIQAEYQKTVIELAKYPEQVKKVAFAGFFKRVWRSIQSPDSEIGQEGVALSARAVRLTESMADLEYAIGSNDLLKRRLSYWLIVHIVVSVIFYTLLGMHIWSGVYFGLRWFQ